MSSDPTIDSEEYISFEDRVYHDRLAHQKIQNWFEQGIKDGHITYINGVDKTDGFHVDHEKIKPFEP